jgi:hypothetical protein
MDAGGAGIAMFSIACLGAYHMGREPDLFLHPGACRTWFGVRIPQNPHTSRKRSEGSRDECVFSNSGCEHEYNPK